MLAKEMAADLFKALRGYIARRDQSIEKRLREVESKPAVLRDLTAVERAEIVEHLKPHMEAAHAKWALDFERNATDVMLKAVAAIPEPKDGRDGVGWDDMQVEHDGKRMVSFKFIKDGEVRHITSIVIPCVIDAGFYQEGMEVQKGDGLTFGGSYWIAQKDTNTKPEIGNPDYRLAVKKGRDGKNADRAETRPVLKVS